MYYKALLKDSFLYIPTKVLPALTTIFFTSFLFRQLDSKSFVNYSVVVAISLISTQLSSGWVANSIIFYLPNRKNAPSFLAQALSVTALSSVFGILIGALVIVCIGATYNVVLAAILLMVGQAGFYVLSSVFQSRRKIHAQLVAVALQCVFQMSALFLFFGTGHRDESSAVLAYATGFSIASVYYFLLMFAELRLILPADLLALIAPKSTDVSKIVCYGVPLGLWSFFTLATASLDRFFLKILPNAANAASYVSAKDLLVGAASLVTMPLLMASHPIILRLAREEKWCDAEDIIRNNIQILTLLFSVYLTLVQFAGLFFLRIMFGNKYQMDVQVLLVMLFGLLFSCISMYVQKRLEASGQTMYMAGLAGVSAVIGALCGSITIPYFGVMGAAFSFVISNLLYLILVARRAGVSINTFFRLANFIMPAMVWIVGYTLDKVVQSYAGSLQWKLEFTKGAWFCSFILALIIITFFSYGRFVHRISQHGRAN
jgi:O-antigen/teichoic acid export membrane protein